jgi:hypothetical protein
MPGSLFQWSGGTIQVSPSAPFTNTGTMTLSGGNVIGGNFWNIGTMIQAGTNGLNIQAGSAINNLNGALFNLQNDAPITVNGGGGSTPAINNYGLFRKSAGTANSIINPNFNNQNGTIEVDSGTLTLVGSGSVTSNATLIVSNAATLDITGGGNPTWSGLITGQGAGKVLLEGGTLFAGTGGLTLKMPGSLFQWSGGTIRVSASAPFTNTGTMTLSGGNVVGGNFWNIGTMIQTGTNGLNLQYSSAVNNLSSGLFDLQNDAPITVNGGGGSTPAINNYGLFRKSAGTANSIINPNFNNQNGIIEVDTGTLTLVGSGSVTSNATLIVSNAATLDLTGGGNPTWSGIVTGSGKGQVLLEGGNLIAGAGGLTMDLAGSMFQWMGGNIAVYGSNPFTNAGTMNLSGGNVWGGNFWNTGTMVQAGSGGLNIQGGSAVNNLSKWSL